MSVLINDHVAKMKVKKLDKEYFLIHSSIGKPNRKTFGVVWGFTYLVTL